MRKLRQTLGVSQEINAETNTVIISTIGDFLKVWIETFDVVRVRYIIWLNANLDNLNEMIVLC